METYIERTGNMIVHQPVKPKVVEDREDPQPCNYHCGQPAPCWGCE